MDSPFGALMTLLYGLTAAPASQPRNAILGQSLSLTIAIGVGRLTVLSLWMRQSLAASLAIGAMVKFGVTHPPAGAAAMLFATGAYGWGNLLFVLLGTALSAVVATIVNNSSDARQYPTYWGFPPCPQPPSCFAGAASNGEKQSSEKNESRAHVAIGDSNAVRRLSDSLHC
jgi:CBS-domain-containing membrane protein